MSSKLGVTTDTYLLWEHDRAKPVARYWPALLVFLGYDPIPAAAWHERVRARRRALGLTVEAAAALAGVDEGTFSAWEKGREPNQSRGALAAFLATE